MVLSELIKEYKEMCLEDVPVEEVLEDLQKLEGIYKEWMFNCPGIEIEEVEE